MDSPLARVIIAILGGYLVILFILTAYDWFNEEFPRPPGKPSPPESVQHPFYHKQAAGALMRFNRFPENERNAIIANLEAHIITMNQYVTRIDRTEYRVMCIGELHEESTRNFLTEEFFAKISFDTLMLETTSRELQRLIGKMQAGRTYFPMLGADIMGVLRSVTANNPDIAIHGIEETDEQREQPHILAGSRDKSIARNFWKHFRPEMRHIILFGALHCGDEPNWLFHNLCEQSPSPLKNRMINARVLEVHQNGPLEGFVFFLDKIGIERENFVIPDTSRIHPRIIELFQELNRQTLSRYSALIVFRIK